MEKYVYIKQDIAGNYVDFAEPLKVEEYNNLGTTWDDFLENKWVLLSDEQVLFMEANPNASVKEVWDMEIVTPSADVLLRKAKQRKMKQITDYDKSNSVNSFTVNGTQEGWLTPDERSNYKSSIDAAKLMGVSTLSFFLGNSLLTLTTEQAEMMLAKIQLYADQCYIVTKQHKMHVEALTSVEEVEGYDHETGYPERLNFNIE